MIRRKNSNDKECSVESSLEVGMLSKSTFNDQELDNYLRQGEIKACEKPPVPPQILWVGDCTIATHKICGGTGGFSHAFISPCLR